MSTTNDTAAPRPDLTLLAVDHLVRCEEPALILEARELAADTEVYREMVIECLRVIADLTQQLARAKATIVRLREAMRLTNPTERRAA